jgi:hypothetical protein
VPTSCASCARSKASLFEPVVGESHACTAVFTFACVQADVRLSRVFTSMGKKARKMVVVMVRVRNELDVQTSKGVQMGRRCCGRSCLALHGWQSVVVV